MDQKLDLIALVIRVNRYRDITKYGLWTGGTNRNSFGCSRIQASSAWSIQDENQKKKKIQLVPSISQAK